MSVVCPPLEWWQYLDARVQRLTIRNEALSVVSSVVKVSHRSVRPGRVRGGSARRASSLAVLAQQRFGVAAVMDAFQVPPQVDEMRPPIGGLRIEHQGIEVTLGVRIDDVAEI